MTINLTPIIRQLRKLNNPKLILVGTILLVIVASVVVATIDINSMTILKETVIEGTRFF